jgi:dipeptidyl-peptidase-4
MTRRTALALVFSAICALGQKKPVTLESLSTMRPGRDMGMPTWAPDARSFVFTQAGKAHLYDVGARKARELFALNALSSSAQKVPAPDRFAWENRMVREQAIQWSPDGRVLLVAAGGDIFLWNVAAAGFEQLTKTPFAERDPKLSPDGKLVAFRREHDLYVLNLATRKEIRLTTNGSDTLRNGELDWVYPEELDLSTAYWWSPDSSKIAYLQFDVSREPLYPHADLLGLKAIYEPERYPQAGDPNANVRLGVISATGGSTRWMDIGHTEDQYLVARVAWMPGGRRLAVQRTNRVQNQLDLLAFDIGTGEASLLLRETDPYWINVADDLRFLKDGERFIWTSERDGNRHIYVYQVRGGEPVRLTSGDWPVRSVAGVDEAQGIVYYISGEPGPLESHLYSIHLNGGEKRRITTSPGTHRISMPPSADVYIDSYSSLESPPRRTLNSAADGKELAVLSEADRKPLQEYDLLPTEIVKLKAADGKTDLYARLIRPAGFDVNKKYPVIVQVYGGPHAQSVTNSWSGLDWDQVLAHKGFVIWQVDNRGSWGRGHWFETPVYHQLGVEELADQKAALQHLIGMGFVDPARVGVNGWSYGGFMTLNCILNAPDMFRAGIAGAPVTNFRNYDSIYTERYMGLPSDNPDGYAKTDLTKSASNLKGRLMLIHNTDDDNVLFQNMLQMTNALQQAGKQFEFMLYPQKTHGVTGAVARQMRGAMTDFFVRVLEPGK